MKHYLSGIIVALSLALVLVLGVVALAENEPQTPELPAASDLQTPTEAPDAAPATDGSAQATEDNTALQEALQAYREARESAREQELQNELNGYVADGKLTQEQADLIMNYYKERQSMRNGTCPSCGYQFQNGTNGKGGHGGKGGRMNGGMNGMGGKGGRGGFGGWMNGFGGQMNSGNADGMSVQGQTQTAPQMNGDEGI
jgi:hypothetical protein